MRFILRTWDAERNNIRSRGGHPQRNLVPRAMKILMESAGYGLLTISPKARAPGEGCTQSSSIGVAGERYERCCPPTQCPCCSAVLCGSS
jgi:hypothetical protein